MPKIAMDYSKTIMYKIVCNDLTITECYVGHTTNFTKRKNSHKSSCNKESNKKNNCNLYKFIRENGGWNNWSMIEVEKYPCNDINEALKRERYWLEELKATLNMVKQTRTIKEWYNDNKEKILEYRKEYYDTNKEDILEYRKEYYDTNKEKYLKYQKEYYDTNKEDILEYREKNKEDILEYRKEYYDTNKEKILKYQKEYREANKEKIKEYRLKLKQKINIY